MKSFGILINVTSIYSFVYIMQLSTTDYVGKVGDLASYFGMKSRCLFPQVTDRPLILPSLFFLMNI